MTMLRLLARASVRAASTARYLPRSTPTTASLAARRTFSTPQNGADQEQQPERFFPVYVHQVSKSVLEHLQNSRSNWIRQEGLERGLHINANGTFVLQFPATQNGFDSGRIWTSYDTSTKQHWLSLYKGKFQARFLLKDTNTNTTFYAQHLSTTQQHATTSLSSQQAQMERQIQGAVDQMIVAYSASQYNNNNNRPPTP
eukprot:CAMPEP_0172439480 /NCGR_PEP_ID=MMETSP1065-20121228/457_1 /TAXON_ID=265537 /ORGANISM="Amphiprora paludosa, Strain CCMP125" /LENGTH=198 /DNA_ID=CAMNT_0013188167 /DNA_START=25 /DNA_END=621 /DNA_ORIENTATION=+